ncbi:hypothetical protein OPQ81_011794 [Rhizoctonia solani]|nr:hypothetical protein OPQ81_011794 [Rhizoctonia solani]
MSRPEAGPSRRRRQCDGAQPVCGPCSSSGHECTWGTEGEDSGRPATKQFIESLRVKIQQLESEIAQLKRGQHQTQSSHSTPSQSFTILPGPSPGPIEPLWSVAITPQTPRFGQALPDIHLSSPAQDHTIPEFPRPAQPIQLPPVEVPAVNTPPIVPALKYQYIFNIDTSLPLDEQYPSHRASLICQWDRHLPDLSPLQLSRFEHDTILHRCISFGASCFFGLVPDLFLAELLQCLAPEAMHPQIEGSRYYTPLLHCSLLAFGAGFSDSPEIRARETRVKFAMHAKRWLSEEFNYPSPSLVLSLALLSEYHSGIGERNTAYMYMGMAMHAARAPAILSNHLDLEWQWWSIFVQECLMALEIKGSRELPTPRLTITCPVTIEPDSRPPLTDSLAELLSHTDYFKYSARCLIQMCKLTSIATRMIDHPGSDQQTILDIHLQLESWFNTLPEGVLIRQRSVLTFPPVLALHITYWWFILNSHLTLADQISLSTTEPVRDLSIKMCARATEKLVQLFNAFDKQYGLRYFPRNLVKAIQACGSALVIERDSASSASRKKRAMATEGIETCINALKVVGEVWPFAIRMGQELEALAGLDPSE